MTSSPLTADSLGSEPGSPLWWVRRLHSQVTYRRPLLQRLQQYYDGEFALRYADDKLRQAFGNVFYASRFGLNWMRLVVGAVEERLQVEGIRVGEGRESDPAAWDIWQAANLDETSSMAHLEALLNGVAYVTVWPSDDAQYPDITVEHPAQAIVEIDPKHPQKRLAGLRIYEDAFNFLHAELFLPDAVYVFKSHSANAAQTSMWEPTHMTWQVDTNLLPDGSMINPWGVVPMVPLRNVPQLVSRSSQDVAHRSEMWPVMPIQDKINSLVFNALLVANSQGFRQRWVTGLTLEVDEDGQPRQPFQAGIDRLMVAEDPGTKFGEFSVTDVTPLVGMLDALIHSIAAISQVPPHYFSASADRLSGESIKAAESGLVAKVRRKQVTFGGTWEEVLRLAGLMTGNDALAKARGAEIMWANPETRSIAQTADAALKYATVGVPWRATMAFLGFSPQAIARMEQERASDALTGALVPQSAGPRIVRPAG